MTEGFSTKNLPYRSGFPTPTALPDTAACRVFRIPADDENAAWQATFMGLISVLCDADMWVQFEDGLDAETCAERWQEMVDNAYDTSEFGCAVTFPAPDDQQVPVFRLNPETGKLEQLSEQQEWVAPQGAYAVPDVPARGGTEQDAKCLAAANCANVLETLYETIVDGIASELTDAEILEAVITAFVAAVGWGAAAGILFSLGFIGLVIIGAVIAVVALLASDVWDASFTDALRCVLYNCALYDAGVITFDYDCVVNELAAQTDLTLDQLRLFGQMVFIINAIGGADGLNQAGTTTEITVADCSACEPGCVVLVDFNDSGLYEFVVPTKNVGVCAAGTLDEAFGDPEPSGHAAQGTDNADAPGMWVAVQIPLGASHDVTAVDFDFWYERTDAAVLGIYIQFFLDGVQVGEIDTAHTDDMSAWTHYSGDGTTRTADTVIVTVYGSGGGFTGDCWIDNICVSD